MLKRKVIDNPVIDENVESYKQFFDHKWCLSMFEKAEGTKIEQAVDDLMISWRSADGAHRMPWLMTHSLQSFAVGDTSANLKARKSYSETMVEKMAQRLVQRMRGKLKVTQLADLHQALRKIEKETAEIVKQARKRVAFDVEKYWDFTVKETEFHFAILGTQHMGYCALIFAYEDFLANVIRSVQPDYNSRTEEIKIAFERHFGEALADDCWIGEDVDLARLVRNDVVHNGRRKGKRLDKYNARFVDAPEFERPALHPNLFILVKGKIQITPCNTRYLFGVLRDRATKIVDHVLSMQP